MMTSSRLDRLFVLLETGSSAVTRSAAAKQLGEVQRLHPHELNTLLSRTASDLRFTSWKTRVAAAEAVRAIVANVPQWNPIGLDFKIEEQTASLSSMGRLQFNQFNMEKVLANSTQLMASEGREYDIEEDSTLGIDTKEKLAKQRQLLNARLGLDVVSKIGIDVSGLFTNEDLSTPTPDAQENNFKWEDVVQSILMKLEIITKWGPLDHSKGGVTKPSPCTSSFKWEDNNRKPLKDVVSSPRKTLRHS